MLEKPELMKDFNHDEKFHLTMRCSLMVSSMLSCQNMFQPHRIYKIVTLDMTSDLNVFVSDLEICLGPPTISKQAT